LLNESIRGVEEEKSREMCTRKVELNLYKNIDLLLDELCFILSKKRVFTHFIMNLQEEYDEKVAEEVISIVSGAYEFLVALALAKLYNISVYAWSSNCSKGNASIIESHKFLLWNGLLDFKDNFLIPYMSRASLPDIELCEESSCTLIEVTLGLSSKTLYYELNEVLNHSSALGRNVKDRILVLSVCGREFESFARFVNSAYLGKVEVKSIYSIIATLYKVKEPDRANQCDYMIHYCRSRASNIEKLMQEYLKKKENKDFIYIAKVLKDYGYIVLPAIIYKVYMLSLSI